MDTFVFSKRKIAKAIFITFFALLCVFLTVCAIGQVYNLYKIKRAFTQSFLEIKNIWKEPLSELPIPEFEKNSLYCFDIKTSNNSLSSLTALYSTMEDKNSKNISFINAKGESANLYEIMEFLSSLKNTAHNLQPDSKTMLDDMIFSFPKYINSYDEEIKNSSKKRLTSILKSGLSMPKINKSKFGYNVALLISKAEIKPGKRIIVKSYPETVKGSKYTLKIKKEHVENFLKKTASDGSLVLSKELSELESAALELLKNSDSDYFIFNIIISQNRVHSIECVTPRVFGNAYMIYAKKGNTFSDIYVGVVNITKREEIFQLNAKKDGDNISVSYKNPEKNISVDALGDNIKMNISFEYMTDLRLGFQSKREELGYSVNFYSDTNFKNPPFLNIYIKKGKTKDEINTNHIGVFGYNSFQDLYELKKT